jgi:hypothetical protein
MSSGHINLVLAPQGRLQKLQESLGDVVLLLAMMILVPVVILVAGTPVALVARFIAALVHRL